MGTISIVPSSISSVSSISSWVAGSFVTTGFFAINGHTNTEAELYAGFLDAGTTLKYMGDPSSSANISFIFSLSDPIFSLDGNPPISFNSLPAGLLIDQLVAVFNLSLGVDVPFFGYTTTGSITVGGSLATNVASSIFVYDYIAGGPTLSPIVFIGKNIVLSVGLTGPAGLILVNLQAVLVGISGSYIIGAVTIPIPNPVIQNPLVPIRVGNKIVINSSTGGLAGAAQIQLSYPGHLIILVLGSGSSQDPYLIIDDVIYYWLNFVFVQTEFQLQFYLPFGFGRYSGPITVTLIGNGTQFSGSVVAGTLNILYADASGIYNLIEGQTNDTLYFRDGYTTDVMFLFLMFEDEVYDDNYFSIKEERLRMLAMNDFDEDEYEDNLFTIIGALRIPVTTIETEIPSPFVMTAFLP